MQKNMKQQLLDLTKRLISIPSEKGNPKALSDVLDLVKSELPGIAFKEYEKNGIKSLLFYNTPTIPKRFTVILNAHVDVVPAKPVQYTPVVKGDKLYGRGACDMKSGAAAEILVFKELAKQVSYPLGLQIVTDEETGGFYGTKYQIEQGIRADFVIAGEQTDLMINNLAKGILLSRVTIKGKSGHAAYIWNGENAIANASKFLTVLYKTFPIPMGEAWVTTANVAKIETSNTAFNKIPDDCTITIDMRYIPEDADTVVDKLKSILPKDATLTILEKEPSQNTKAGDPYVVLLSKAIQNVTGNTKTIAKHGASDIRHYDGVGCAGACFGPIAVGLHTDNEYGDIPSFVTYYEILKKFLLSI